MDLDRLEKEFLALKRRCEPMLADYERHMTRGDLRSDRGPSDEDRHDEAQHHLEAGDLDKAGAAINLGRAHDGKEENESFERRIRAALFGAASADAEKPRAAGEPVDEDPVDDGQTDPEKTDVSTTQTG